MGLQQPSIHWGELDSLANGDECSPSKSNLEWNLVHCLDINHQANDHLLGVFVNISSVFYAKGWKWDDHPHSRTYFLQMAWNYQTTDMRSTDMKWVRDRKKKNQTSFKIYLIATSGRDRTLKWWLREIMNGRTFQISVLWQFIQILEPKFEMSGQPSFVCPSYWRYWGTTTYQDGSKKEGNSLSLTRLGTLWVLVWTTLS